MECSHSGERETGGDALLLRPCMVIFIFCEVREKGSVCAAVIVFVSGNRF